MSRVQASLRDAGVLVVSNRGLKPTATFGPSLRDSLAGPHSTPASPAPFIRINVLQHRHEVVAQFAARVPAHLVEQAREIDEALVLWNGLQAGCFIRRGILNTAAPNSTRNRRMDEPANERPR